MNGFIQKKLRNTVLFSTIFTLSVWPLSLGYADDRVNPPFLPSTLAKVESITPPLITETSGCLAIQTTPTDELAEQHLVELVNQERAEVGVPPLKHTPSLDSAARAHSLDLSQDRYFQHDTYDRINNQLSWVCAWSTRISHYFTNWSTIGENIAGGAYSPESAMSLWMNSSGHRANILRPEFWLIGVGYANGGDYGAYWTQDFGRASGDFPLIINGEAIHTTTRDVSIYVYGNWSEIRLRTDDEEWSAWQPFNNQLDYQIEAESGLHTVYAEMRTDTQSAAASDSIILDLPVTHELGNLPSEVEFLYSRADDQFIPEQIHLQPKDISDNSTLFWQISSANSNFSISPDQGYTNEIVTIRPDPLSIGYDPIQLVDTITVTVVSQDIVIGSPYTIKLLITPIDNPFSELYLPLLIR
jgi:uncharacterized protein YkwD